MSNSFLSIAIGREPATSARPPVLAKGTASEEASKTRIILLTAFNKGFYIEESSIYLYN
jgi:hypothetical protein